MISFSRVVSKIMGAFIKRPTPSKTRVYYSKNTHNIATNEMFLQASSTLLGLKSSTQKHLNSLLIKKSAKTEEIENHLAEHPLCTFQADSKEGTKYGELLTEFDSLCLQINRTKCKLGSMLRASQAQDAMELTQTQIDTAQKHFCTSNTRVLEDYLASLSNKAIQLSLASTEEPSVLDLKVLALKEKMSAVRKQLGALKARQ